MSFTQKLTNLKLEELKKQLSEIDLDILRNGCNEYLESKINNLLETPYHKVPGWKELENP